MKGLPFSTGGRHLASKLTSAGRGLPINTPVERRLRYETRLRSVSLMRNRKRSGSGDPVFNPKRKLRPWAGTDDDERYGKSLAAKVRYTGNPAHKRDPGDFDLTPPAAPRQNATLCDDAGILKRKKAIALLR
jgi:hypothetical protein